MGKWYSLIDYTQRLANKLPRMHIEDQFAPGKRQIAKESGTIFYPVATQIKSY